jgi:threonine dehydrogenase-like Zn-dependent dehydrogenase
MCTRKVFSSQLLINRQVNCMYSEDTNQASLASLWSVCAQPLLNLISNAPILQGHETTGEIVELGSAVKNHKKGDTVVLPFTVSCGECFYCQRGFSSRCEKGLLFGCPLLDGGQAEYMRVPLADATAVKAPEGIDEKKLVLMADIFPTGYFAAANAFRGFDQEVISQSVVVLIGCGPVGLCALINALEYKPKVVIAVDRVESRLALAKKLGAEPWNDQKDRAGKLPSSVRAQLTIPRPGSKSEGTHEWKRG